MDKKILKASSKPSLVVNSDFLQGFTVDTKNNVRACSYENVLF